ncbi:MAG: adenosine deaminase family protein [Deltaproteobacteria bacterium]|nr:adenosine deaminase family protein [Deltaproteobacteria bacterium]
MLENTTPARELLLALPKSDLHVHLDGSVRPSTLIELARDYNISLPANTEEGLYQLVFKERYASLAEYLMGFRYATAVMQTEPALERIAYELAIDNLEEGVRYVEVRFAPQLHMHRHLGFVPVVKAVDRGLRRAADEFNARPQIRSGKEPPFVYGIIVCAMRMFKEGHSEYYNNLLHAQQYAPPREVYSLASLELARAAVCAREEYGLPIVGFDLAGEEAGYPPDDHREAYDFAHQNFMKKTVHAGEAYGPESIFQAITRLHADRIGHGTFLLDPEMITDPTITDRSGYVRALSQYIADRRVTLEVCLTSNQQTIPELADLSNHSLRKQRDSRLSVAICTDNRTVSRTTVTRELELAVKHLGFTFKDTRAVIMHGFKRGFYPGTYLSKRRYVRQVLDYLQEVEQKFGSAAGGTPTAVVG